MTGFKVGQAGKGGGMVLEISGEMTLPHAGELIAALLKALDHADQVQVSVAGVTAVDFSALQLLCSAHRSAVSLHKRLGLVLPLPPLFIKAVTDAGYVRHTGCLLPSEAAGCLWIRPGR